MLAKHWLSCFVKPFLIKIFGYIAELHHKIEYPENLSVILLHKYWAYIIQRLLFTIRQQFLLIYIDLCWKDIAYIVFCFISCVYDNCFHYSYPFNSFFCCWRFEGIWELYLWLKRETKYEKWKKCNVRKIFYNLCGNM